TTSEWVAKAEGDFAAASTLMRVRKSPNYDAVAFHAQQCAEKLMKAVLISRKSIPPRTHDLVLLHKLLRTAVPRWSWNTSELRSLTRAAVILRYPRMWATRAQARKSGCLQGAA